MEKEHKPYILGKETLNLGNSLSQNGDFGLN